MDTIKLLILLNVELLKSIWNLERFSISLWSCARIMFLAVMLHSNIDILDPLLCSMQKIFSKMSKQGKFVHQFFLICQNQSLFPQGTLSVHGFD